MTLEDIDLMDEGSSSSYEEPDNNYGDPNFVNQNEPPANASSVQQNNDAGGTGSSTDDDLMMAYLKYSGISDPTKIKFEDNDGIVIEKDWNTLSRDEKFNILTSSSQQPERDLNDEEVNLINKIRNSRLTPDAYIQALNNKATQDYLNNINANPVSSIENTPDDELFILDLQAKIPDISDEEAQELLNQAKQKPELFAKQVAGIKNAMLTQEQQENERLQLEQQQAESEAFEQFKNSIATNISNFKQIGDLDINMTQEDMDELASFILDRDETGVSYFGQMLNDPKSLVQMAWFALKGQEAFASIADYFGNEIKNVRQSAYEKGLADGRGNGSRVVVKPQNQPPMRAGGQSMSFLDVLG